MDQEVGLSMKFLTFRLGSEEYGIDIHKVQEIRSYDTVTHIAGAPDYVKGVINLRGSIVPIIDMRMRFALAVPTYDEFTVAIIVNAEARVVGILVDAVSDVVTLSDKQIKPPPEVGQALHTDHLIGLGILEERMLILLDIEGLVRMQEIELAVETSA